MEQSLGIAIMIDSRIWVLRWLHILHQRWLDFDGGRSKHSTYFKKRLEINRSQPNTSLKKSILEWKGSRHWLPRPPFFLLLLLLLFILLLLLHLLLFRLLFFFFFFLFLCLHIHTRHFQSFLAPSPLRAPPVTFSLFDEFPRGPGPGDARCAIKAHRMRGRMREPGRI